MRTMLRFAWITCLAALFLMDSGIVRALEAGASACDITPDVQKFRVPMAGYGARGNMPSTGIHDPLHAKVLYFRDGARSMTIVTCDLRSITPEFKNQIIQKSAGKGITADNLLVCASHTHDGPALYAEKFWQMQFGQYDPKIVELMSDAVAQAIAEAIDKTAPASVGFASERVEGFTHNRRWEYDTAAREAAGEKPALNPMLSVLRVDGADGTPRAVLVNFATHPTILGADNMLISAEWPGVLEKKLEEAFPGAIALFANGAEGDQAPGKSEGKDAFERVTDFGSRLAKEAERVARGIKTSKAVPIAFVRVTPDLPSLSFSEKAKSGPYKHMVEAALTDLPKKAEVQLLRIGDVMLAGLPGEPLSEVGQSVQKALDHDPAKNRFVIVVGLSNDYLGYIVNEKEYAHGGYEVDSRSYYGPGLGNFLVEAARTAAAEIK